MLLVTSATAAATAASASSAVIEFPFHHRARFIHGEVAAAKLASVELLDRLVRVGIFHHNKSKTFGPAGIPIGNNRDGFHGTELRKDAVEFFFRRLKR
jgi:hypothetical protein